MLPFSNPDPSALLAGRIWRPGIGPALVALRGEAVIDITSRAVPTMRDLLELDDPAAHLRDAPGETVCTLADLAAAAAGEDALRWLAPCDLQAVKACGVTFAESMVERVIEEQAAGDADRAQEIRARVGAVIGDSLSGIVPGSGAAMEVKRVLQAEGLWSQYLEVGIGPDAEVFSKAQPMSAVGWGADVGIHPVSTWNNPEPEIVLAVNSRGRILGATLGNDVNLRDVEGRSALLLGKAKDNNAACAIGPLLRLFDDGFSLADVEGAELALKVEGEDGFVLDGHSSMSKISRSPADLAAQTIGRHHQYPDGFFLFLGTLFAPIQDRDAPGQGFTHKAGDVVTITEAKLGALRNTVRLSTECPEWTFGTAALMRNLAGRGLL
ncbi:fumarylacetoacetate hydrolase family protein [Mangrovicoccus algicola]|uniref:Fumarylacetoacetate hydrolase family protein n=1 Tax=Mangrovicoccus algicola TaxID=2771008 RepID=A0A8J7CK80_9RHOB|nr:fumarylacetoacetate hydrolase family protein [Mangrovicoccus algicola]MBE3638431.1 fumarylacetoacetate hydrolase family protein [Mangrovicoccus algicola]